VGISRDFQLGAVEIEDELIWF